MRWRYDGEYGMLIVTNMSLSKRIERQNRVVNSMFPKTQTTTSCNTKHDLLPEMKQLIIVIFDQRVLTRFERKRHIRVDYDDRCDARIYDNGLRHPAPLNTTVCI